MGLTDTLLPVTEPTLGLMLRLVAPVTDQVRMLFCPRTMLAGLARKLEMIGRLPAV